MPVNWEAVSAIAAAATLLTGFWAAFRGGRRSVISFEQHEVQGHVAGIKELLNSYSDRVTARRTILKNRGGHVDNVSIRFEISDLVSHQISQTSSIDKDQITFMAADKKGLTVRIPDFPAGEKIEIDLLAGDRLSKYDYPIGGSSKFRLLENADFIWRRIFIIGGSLAMTILIFKFAPQFFERLN